MRGRTRFVAAIAALSVFAVVTVAYAATLSVTASPLQVTYPHSSRLTITFPSTGPATATILSMPVGGSIWTTTTLRATTPAPTVGIKPRVNTVYRAWLPSGLFSDPVTVSVAAHLFQPQVGGNVHSRHTYLIKGSMQPAEVGATVTVETWRLTTHLVKHGRGPIRRVQSWERVPDSAVGRPLVYRNSQLSTWTMTWTPASSGWWKIVASHEDTSHVKSVATTYRQVHN